MRELHLVVVPTSGNCIKATCGGNVGANSVLEPGKACQHRLKTAAELLRSDSDAILAISGGARWDASRSEAAVANRWFCASFTDFVDRIRIVDAQANYTAADMVYLAERINQLWHRQWPSKITIVSHPDHAEMARTYLDYALFVYWDASIPIGLVSSGEPAPYKWLKLMAHRFANRYDIEWRRWPSWPLRVMANRRIYT